MTKIHYAIDVNTGAHINTETIGKNGIASCEIVLSDVTPADRFGSHKTLGELILIDRVTNATSACGVVTDFVRYEGKTGKASFVSGKIRARGDIFEEFLYDTESMNVFKYQPVSKTYTVGDEIPVSGRSYCYPDSFDILVMRDGAAVLVVTHDDAVRPYADRVLKMDAGRISEEINS